MPGLVACVVSDRTAEIRFSAGILDDVIGQTLSALADRTIVDRVRADRIHLASSTARAERDDGPKDVVELFPLFVAYVLDDFVAVFRIAIFGQPLSKVFNGRFADQISRAELRGWRRVTVGSRLETIGSCRTMLWRIMIEDG